MARTRHIHQRMSQRGIKTEMLSIAKQFGTWDGDKCILNRKACKEAVTELDRIRKSFIKMQERGGIVIVEADDVEITTYALDSYKRLH